MSHKDSDSSSDNSPVAPGAHAELPSLNCYLALKMKKNKGKGKRIHIQFTLDEIDLYRTKLKKKHQTEPIPIQCGSEVHYSKPADFYLTPSQDFTKFALRHGDIEIMTCQFEKGKKGGPKTIKVVWKENPDNQIVFVNKKPEKSDNGQYILDFDGRYAAPSTQNCILIREDNQELAAMYRSFNEWETDIDAKPGMPDLMLFGVLLSLDICPF
ncbi:hypothetical protein M9Y10_011492 [Tritrichomonas musculus]|uniref:Tubby C-terminal domain-containing protein n=1 Tax=Tritrichomonas musculus TaxID=1915356 RepID=A0ABR2IKP8_9EUKA